MMGMLPRVFAPLAGMLEEIEREIAGRRSRWSGLIERGWLNVEKVTGRMNAIHSIRCLLEFAATDAVLFNRLGDGARARFEAWARAAEAKDAEAVARADAAAAEGA